MNAPQGAVPRVLMSAAALGAGIAGGVFVGQAIQPNLTKKAAAGIVGGSIGGLATAFAGVAVAMASPKWRGVGEMTALIGLGGFTAVALLSALQPSGALSTAAAAPAALPAGPTQYNLTTADSGQTLALKKGDQVSVTLPVAGSSFWSWLSTNAPILASSGTVRTLPPVSEVDSFVAAQTGTTTLSAQLSGGGATFTLNAVVT